LEIPPISDLRSKIKEKGKEKRGGHTKELC
jgi:hypothetical protein